MKNKVEETMEFVHNNYWYCQRGRYSKSSVLAGQEYRQLVHAYNSLEDAKIAHPSAAIEDRPVDKWEMSINPPSWFDPMSAGEVWNEEDY